jgi:hypothetical protein
MFEHYSLFWVDYLSIRHGISLGIHLDWLGGRLDFHLGPWIVSVGRIPIYEFRGKRIAVSASYHRDKVRSETYVPSPHYDRPRR